MRLLFYILKTFSKKELIAFVAAAAICVVSGSFLFLQTIARLTTIQPASGGKFTEGIVGQPAFLNPLLARNGTPDKDLSALLFANMTDIAESIKSDKAFQVWNIRIKENASWHDESPITSDDIIFTVTTIQNPDTASPLFSDWQNIHIERVSELEVRFELASSYSLFSNILSDLRPVPKKVFANISPANIKLSSYNLEPIGSGPFKFTESEKKRDGFITSYRFSRNPFFRYIGKEPYLKEFNIKFFENETELTRAYDLGSIDGFFSSRPPKQLKINSRIIDIPTAKYYAVFFNQNSYEAFASSAVRHALSLATDKKAIIDEIFSGKAIISNGPIPPVLSSFSDTIDHEWRFSPQEAVDLLEKDGWQINENTGVREKKRKNTAMPLSFTIKTPDSIPLKDAAEKISEQWRAIGVDAKVVKVDSSRIADEAIKTRDYQAILFGNITLANPDLFSFWHSSEKFSPGLNLSLYENRTVDNAISLLRKMGHESPQRFEVLRDIQKIIASETPAVFLVSPYSFYVYKANIPGIAIGTIVLPSDRFIKVSEWHVSTARALR